MRLKKVRYYGNEGKATIILAFPIQKVMTLIHTIDDDC
jgi:hypothetical protein